MPGTSQVTNTGCSGLPPAIITTENQSPPSIFQWSTPECCHATPSLFRLHFILILWISTMHVCWCYPIVPSSLYGKSDYCLILLNSCLAKVDRSEELAFLKPYLEMSFNKREGTGKEVTYNYCSIKWDPCYCHKSLPAEAFLLSDNCTQGEHILQEEMWPWAL
ncbi:neuropeptide S [Alligator mississippiensis]|uniref:Neuropeptide S n=1 Tax=Alligator mississippiensis TaxID=8496 RepID=A0A151P4B2_ALLMI|nr:neuropeptide S [Alligator mississippiensis]